MKSFRFFLFVCASLLAGAAFFSHAASAADCTADFTNTCSSFHGQTQSGSCDSSGRLYISTGGSAGTLSSIGSSNLMHCGGTTGLYCCALQDSERCDKMTGYNPGDPYGIQCLPQATCDTADSCMLGGKAYTTYDGKACVGDGYVCCQKLSDALRKTGCVSTPPGTAADTYSETACDAVGGTCGSSCGSFETASPSVNCGVKTGVAYACCLAKNTCTDGGGYCADSCQPGDAPNPGDTSCPAPGGTAQTCCAPTKTATTSPSATAAKAGAGGSSGAAAAGVSTYGSLSAPNPGNYHPPVNATVGSIVATLIKNLLALVGVVVLGMFFYGGFLWMTAAGDAKQAGSAKSVLTSSLIGLVIIVAAYVLASNLVQIIGTAFAP